MSWAGGIRREIVELFVDAQDPVVREVREAWFAEARSRWGAHGRARKGRCYPTPEVRERRGWETAVLRLRRLRLAQPPARPCPEAGSHACAECGARFATLAAVLAHSWRRHRA